MRSSEIPSVAQLDMMDRYPQLREKQTEEQESSIAAFYRHLDGE